MTDLKITIDQLKNYLGTGLEFYAIGEYKDDSKTLIEFEIHGFSGKGEWVEGFGRLQTITDHYPLSIIKPICYRLSDLSKFIPEMGFVPIEEIRELNLGHTDWISKERDYMIKKYGIDYWVGHIPFAIMQKLFEWHFWPFGEEYFEQGSVIDKLKHETK